MAQQQPARPATNLTDAAANLTNSKQQLDAWCDEVKPVLAAAEAEDEA